MKKRRFSSGDMINKTISEIKKFAPWSQIIQVRLREEPKGHFNTIISLKSRRINLVAHKEDVSPLKSLSKTRQAMLKQIEKVHTKKRIPVSTRLEKIGLTPSPQENENENENEAFFS